MRARVHTSTSDSLSFHPSPSSSSPSHSHSSSFSLSLFSSSSRRGVCLKQLAYTLDTAELYAQLEQVRSQQAALARRQAAAEAAAAAAVRRWEDAQLGLPPAADVYELSLDTHELYDRCSESLNPVFSSLRQVAVEHGVDVLDVERYGRTYNLTVECGAGGVDPTVLWGRSVRGDQKHLEHEVAFNDTPPHLFKNEELVVARCKYSRFGAQKLKHNVYWNNIYDPQVARVAAQRAQADAASTPTQKSPFDGMNVLFLAFDATSRAQFIRSVPRTLELLNSLNDGPHYAMFNFSGLNVVGYDTAENIPAFFAGYRYTMYQDSYHNVKPGVAADQPWGWDPVDGDEQRVAVGPSEETQNQTRSPDTWIWDHFRKHGYVTLDGAEICLYSQLTNKFMPEKRERTYADVRTGDVFCIKQYCCCCDAILPPVDEKKLQSHPDRVCLGPRAAFSHSFQYLLQFQDNYRNHSRFASYNILLGHEPSLKGFARIDDHLRSFLASTLLHTPHPHARVRPVSKPDTMVVLLGDHGIQYGEFSNTPRGQQEHKNPPLYIILPRHIINDHPSIGETLRANLNRFITHFDVYNTLMHVPLLERDLERGKVRVPPWSYNLMRQVIPEQRECAEAQVPDGYCAKTTWTPIQVDGVRDFVRHPNPTRDPASGAPLDVPLVLHAAQAIVDHVNRAIAESRPGYPAVCQPLAILDVIEAHHDVLKGQHRNNDGAYERSIRFDQFKLRVLATPVQEQAQYLKPDKERPEYHPTQVITLDGLVSLEHHPDVDSWIISMAPDLTQVKLVHRTSLRSHHESCMAPRDPHIPAAYCVCDPST